MQKISRIVARVGPKGKETQPVTRVSSPFWAWAHDSTKRRSERRARKRRRERSSRRRRSAPFDLACNPVGPRGLTDVMRGVRGPVRTRRYRLSVRCVRCTRLWICPYGPYGAPGVGDVNLAELMNDETGLLWRHHETADGGAGGVLPFWIMPW